MSTSHSLDEDIEASKQPILSTETDLHFKCLSDTPSPPPSPSPPASPACASSSSSHAHPSSPNNLCNAQVNAKYYPHDARSKSKRIQRLTRATVDSHSPETGRSSGVTFASHDKLSPSSTVTPEKVKNCQQWQEQNDPSQSTVTRTSSNHENCSCNSPTRVNGNNNNHKNHSRSFITAPDGGWGWVVVFASFMISLIADGISFSFGIIFLELSDYFNESKSKTAFVGSLFMSIPLLVGPLASALTDRYGCRKITIVSGIISSIGFILGHLSTCIEHLFIAFSIAGAGLALSYVTSIVIVAYYFEKRRSLATGLAVCGTGFGTFIFPPLTIHLLDEYTWRGTLLIMSGFFLNIVVFGALMRDLPATNDDVDCDSESSIAIVDTYSRESEEPYTRKRLATFSGSKVTTPDINVTSFDCSTGGCNKSINSVSPRMTSSMVHIPTYLTHRGSTSDNQDVLNELWSKKGGYLNRLLEKYPEIVRPMIHLFPSTGPINSTGTRICPPPPPPPPLSLPSAALTVGPVSTAGGPVSSPPPPPPPPPPRAAACCSPLSPTFVCPSSATPTSATAGHSLVNSPFTTSHNGESFSSPSTAAAAAAAVTVVEKTTTDASREATSNTISPGTVCNSHSFTATTVATTTAVNNHNDNYSSTSNNMNNNNNNYNCTVNSYMNNHSNNNYNGSHENADPGHLIFNNNNESAPSSVKSPALISNISIRSPKIIGKRLSVNPIGYRLNSLIPFEHGSQAKKLQRGSITYRSAMLNIRRYRMRSSSCPDMVAVAGRVTHTSPAWLTDVKNFFHDVIDISIFRSLKYSLFCFSNLLLYACIDVPYVYIPDHAIMSGSSDKEHASMLISSIGIVNTGGIVLVGFVGDLPWVSPPLLYSLAICLAGLSIFFIPIVNSYHGLVLLSSLYGLTISANYALVSVILVDLISLDNFTIGYGLLLLVQGIASLIGPPLAGWLCDQTGSYSVTFFATGVCIFISGAIVLPISSSRSRFSCQGQLLQQTCTLTHSQSPVEPLESATVTGEMMRDLHPQTSHCNS